MRDKWYADNRDLVKWGVVLTLAERHAVTHILHVSYYRSTEWGRIEVDSELVQLPESVIRHFRKASLSLRSGRIEVLLDPFIDREAYHSLVIERIRNRPSSPGIVRLDPDTGLQPQTPSFDHVLNNELTTRRDRCRDA